ncbi:MAG: hypothetical protein ABL984_18170 [Pyrinomonadaceae bacterium]
MDLVNDLSSDVALAVFVEGRLRQKLGAQDAKSFIALIEAELNRISTEHLDHQNPASLAADLSH